MEELEVAEEIYSAAMQIMNAHGISASAVPLIMGVVTSRTNAFAIGELAREASAARHKQEDSDAS